MNALPAGSLEYSATTSSAAWSICPSSATQQLHVRLPRYRCTNKRCLQKIFRAGLACAPDNSKTTDQVTHWILQRLCLNRCRCTQVIRPGVGYEVSQVLFRLMKPVFETTYGAQRTPMPKLPQHRLPHQTHDSGIHTLNRARPPESRHRGVNKSRCKPIRP